MKTIITVICLLVVVHVCYGKDFSELPVHKDNFFSTVNLPIEEELNKALKERQRELNIVLNYLKTIDFCDGAVSRYLYDKYLEAKAGLPEDITKKLTAAEKEILERKKRNLSVIDIESNEHFLPIKILNLTK